MRDIDQNPRRIDRFELYQGIANLAPNGPDDGGLCVLRGSHLMHQDHFDAIGGFRESGDAGEKENGYTLGEGDDEWYIQHGCEAVKICAGKGDLICESGSFCALQCEAEWQYGIRGQCIGMPPPLEIRLDS